MLGSLGTPTDVRTSPRQVLLIAQRGRLKVALEPLNSTSQATVLNTTIEQVREEDLVVSQPTWGVDAGAAATIRQALIDLASRGAAVLVISQDLDEIEEIADRVAVMFRGKLSAPLAAAEATREALGLLMGGAAADAAQGRQETQHAVGA